MKNDVIEIVDLMGERKKYDILLTFDSNNTNKSYVVYTNYQKAEDDRIIVYASMYEYVNEKLILSDVNTLEESNFIDKFLKEQQKEVNFYLKSKVK